jgi:hypothetical protein
VKNVVRLMGVGLLVAGQLVACGGEGAGEGVEGSKPVMSELHVSKDGVLMAPKAEQAPESQPGRVHQLGPAPNLSSVQVYAICSEAFYNVYNPYDCEDVTAVGTTGFNHGGAWVVAITKEMGYRAYGNATFAGLSVPELTNYAEAITNPYNEIIGWYRYWERVPAPQSGQFKYTAASINTYAQYSDWVTVQ